MFVKEEIPVIERRRHVRYPSQQSALFFNAQKAVFARLFDASETGLGVRSSCTFHLGEVIGVKINSAIHLRARVVWTRGNPQPGMGLSLIEIVEGNQEFHQLVGSN